MKSGVKRRILARLDVYLRRFGAEWRCFASIDETKKRRAVCLSEWFQITAGSGNLSQTLSGLGCCPYGAHDVWAVVAPRALPWASFLRPLRGHSDEAAPFHKIRFSDLSDSASGLFRAFGGCAYIHSVAARIGEAQQPDAGFGAAAAHGGIELPSFGGALRDFSKVVAWARRHERGAFH